MNEKETVSLQGADPKTAFYITGDLYLDDSIDVESEGKQPYSFDTCLEVAKGMVEEHGGEVYVIECRAIRKVSRAKPKIETIRHRPSKD